MKVCIVTFLNLPHLISTECLTSNTSDSESSSSKWLWTFISLCFSLVTALNLSQYSLPRCSIPFDQGHAVNHLVLDKKKCFIWIILSFLIMQRVRKTQFYRTSQWFDRRVSIHKHKQHSVLFFFFYKFIYNIWNGSNLVISQSLSDP